MVYLINTGMISMWIVFLCLISSCENNSCCENHLPVPTTLQDSLWQFESTPSWADEFNYSGKPDPSKWGYDIGGDGWGNNELQYYTDNIKNAAVANGLLTITAIREPASGREYSSARLVSKNKGDFLYGRIEVKAKLPSGKGTWPAIWMLPTDWEYGGWPKSGEIDIMEHVGFDQDRVHITVHTEAYNHSIGTQVGKSRVVTNASSDFHLYKIEWTPSAILGYIDDQLLFEFKNEGTGPAYWPFDKRFHMLLNIAVGGNWGGQQGVDSSIWPASMEVDYVRYYKMVEKK
jgi:beta-glucanase (GH16 family)